MLLKDKNKNTDEIKRIDIALAYYIKKRAKVTKGGFNFIPKEMWEWQPIFEIDSSLLPKIKRIDFSYTDYGVLYKIRMYGANGKELYILGDDDDVFKYNRLDADNVRYIAQQLKIPVTDDFAGRSYNFD